MYYLEQDQYDILSGMGLPTWEADWGYFLSEQPQALCVYDAQDAVAGLLWLAPCPAALWQPCMQLLVAMMQAIQLRIRPYRQQDTRRILVLGRSSEQGDLSGYTVITTHALDQLLQHPELKKSAWDQLRLFIGHAKKTSSIPAITP